MCVLSCACVCAKAKVEHWTPSFIITILCLTPLDPIVFLTEPRTRLTASKHQSSSYFLPQCYDCRCTGMHCFLIWVTGIQNQAYLLMQQLLLDLWSISSFFWIYIFVVRVIQHSLCHIPGQPWWMKNYSRAREVSQWLEHLMLFSRRPPWALYTWGAQTYMKIKHPYI